jgi:hypothetical protein
MSPEVEPVPLDLVVEYPGVVKLLTVVELFSSTMAKNAKPCWRASSDALNRAKSCARSLEV